MASAKIEGRMKRPEYVAAATAVCRYAADGKEIPEELAQKLEAVFPGPGSPTAILPESWAEECSASGQKEDVEAATSDVLKELRQLYKDEKQTIPLDFRVEIHKGRPAALHGKDSEGHSAMAQGPAPKGRKPWRSPRRGAWSSCKKQEAPLFSAAGWTPTLIRGFHCRYPS